MIDMAAPNVKAYNGNDPFIFVSYSHKDRDAVFPFIAALQKRYNVWFDEGLHYGKEWDDEIVEHLEKCSLFLFMVTEHSLSSINCRDELTMARESGVNFINVCMNRDTTFPSWFSFRFGRFQHCNLFSFDSCDAAVEDLSRKSDWFEGVAAKTAAAPARVHPEEQKQAAAGAANVLQTAVHAREPDDVQERISKAMAAVSAKDYAKAYEIYTVLESTQRPVVLNGLGICYENWKKDQKKAVEYYRKAADLGYAAAVNNLGLCYENGKGVEKDPSKAAAFFLSAADEGSPAGNYNLGRCFETGKGVDKNISKAVAYYRIAAERAYAAADCRLGYFYEHGIGVERDVAKAVDYYQKAADMGNAAALHNLGLCYEYGRYGLEKNTGKALDCYRKAADLGYSLSQLALGNLYYFGLGVTKDLAKAVDYYRKASDSGNAYAQFSLGQCYEKGEGVEKNTAKALEWYRKAADQGNADAKRKLEKLEDLSEFERRLVEFENKP